MFTFSGSMFMFSGILMGSVPVALGLIALALAIGSRRKPSVPVQLPAASIKHLAGGQVWMLRQCGLVRIDIATENRVEYHMMEDEPRYSKLRRDGYPASAACALNRYFSERDDFAANISVPEEVKPVDPDLLKAEKEVQCL